MEAGRVPDPTEDSSGAAAFPPDYATARERFRSLAARQGARVEEHVHPSAQGAQGEALAIDTAMIGSPDAPALLLLTSGTHGVEGFCGSGCQADLLSDPAFLRAVDDAGIAALFVHALNPYGFSHLRRVNEDNVDLNRNFRDFSTPAPAAPLYGELHAVLLPAQWPPTPDNDQAINALVARHGLAVFQAIVSGGQYEFPDGMFYGGASPTWSNRTLRALLRRHGLGRERLAWIDYHTGLGPAGHAEKIFAGRNDAADLARARAWWGADVTSFHEGSSSSAALKGAMYEAAYEECPHVEFTGVTLEFGTVPLPQVFTALRADHWLRNHPESPPALRAGIKAFVRGAFYVETPVWRDAVLAQSRDVVFKTVERLAASGTP